MSARKSSHRTIFLIVSNGSPLALIASSLRSTSKKPVCPMTRSLHPPMAHCRQRVRFAATWREKFFEVPCSSKITVAVTRSTMTASFCNPLKLTTLLDHSFPCLIDNLLPPDQFPLTQLGRKLHHLCPGLALPSFVTPNAG